MPKLPLQVAAESDALTSLLCYRGPVELWTRHPPARDAASLWTTFFRNAHPFLKVFFEWDVQHLKEAALSHEGSKRFLSSEHALIFAIYFVAVHSLTDDEVRTSFGQTKMALLSQYQWLCEQALAASNFMGSLDIVTLQALTVYMVSCPKALFLSLTENFLVGSWTLEIEDEQPLVFDGSCFAQCRKNGSTS